MTFLRHVLSILLLPTTMTLVVPYFVLSSRPLPGASPLGVAAAVAGIAVVVAGLTLVVGTIRRFVREGRGTLAPWDPPRRLVVTGIYRRVRNPMISGVVLIILGEALAFRSPSLLAWATVFFCVNLIYIPLSEEPGLARRFGDDYREYTRNVPRWIPRRTPWQQPERLP